MKDRMLLVVLVCSLPLGIAWYVAKSIQWERRKGFRGRYEQPIEPWVHGDGARIPTRPETIH